MTDPPEERDWSATDSHADSEHFADYLAKATAMDQIQEYKARSHELLALDPGCSVLDAGCGIGDDIIQLAEHVGETGAAVGVDNSESLIERAQERTAERSQVQFRVGDITDLEFENDRFDASRVDRVLQHLERPDAAVAELCRVTSSGGRIGLTDPDWDSLVIDTPGPGPAHEFLDSTYAPGRNPAMGRRLSRLARDSGLVDLSIDAFVLHSTDFEFVYEIAEFEHWTSAMETADLIDQSAIDEWRERLRSAADDDKFFAAIPAYTITGTVPN